MKEFGSDFHFVEKFFIDKGSSLNDFFPNHYLFADGRHAIIQIMQEYKLKRLWVPQYFCYEVIESLRLANIEIAFYIDYPGFQEKEVIYKIPFQKGDVLLRVNYFGMRNFRSEKEIPIPVIEDHTHNLLSFWALNSDAEWCIASLRKTLPLASGGIAWSPQGKTIKFMPKSSNLNNWISENRWKAMRMKSAYLATGLNLQKEAFREIMISTEEKYLTLPVSGIDKETQKYLDNFDVYSWYKEKCVNWTVLETKFGSKIESFQSENSSDVMFSWIILAPSRFLREQIRQSMIKSSIYPAVLWQVPLSCDKQVIDISERILSVHCDARYILSDINEMAERLMSIL